MLTLLYFVGASCLAAGLVLNYLYTGSTLEVNTSAGLIATSDAPFNFSLTFFLTGELALESVQIEDISGNIGQTPTTSNETGIYVTVYGGDCSLGQTPQIILNLTPPADNPYGYLRSVSWDLIISTPFPDFANELRSMGTTATLLSNSTAPSNTGGFPRWSDQLSLRSGSNLSDLSGRVGLNRIFPFTTSKAQHSSRNPLQRDPAECQSSADQIRICYALIGLPIRCEFQKRISAFIPGGWGDWRIILCGQGNLGLSEKVFTLGSDRYHAQGQS